MSFLVLTCAITTNTYYVYIKGELDRQCCECLKTQFTMTERKKISVHQIMMIRNEDSNTAADFEKTRKTLNKSLIIELMLRGGGIVSCWNHAAAAGFSFVSLISIYLDLQVLALISIISSSICLNKLMPDHLRQQASTYKSLVLEASHLNSRVLQDTQAAAGWTLFLSLVVFIYQSFAIFQQFVYLKLLFIKIPLGKSIWYLFPLIVSGVHALVLALYIIMLCILQFYNRILLSA